MLLVFGSINLDIAFDGERLPTAGETVLGRGWRMSPGGKGANQAHAAQRYGLATTLDGAVGDDDFAAQALAQLRPAGVDLGALQRLPGQTGCAGIMVDASGENQIVVAPGANARLRPPDVDDLPLADALLCQLEVPLATVMHAAVHANGFVALNLAPALDVPAGLLEHADLVVVNDTEALHYGEALHRGDGLVAITHGARGATLLRAGREVATARPPRIEPVDTTGAGDAFVAALLVALLEQRPAGAALAFACAAGAAAAMTAGAQPSLPTREVVQHLQGVER